MRGVSNIHRVGSAVSVVLLLGAAGVWAQPAAESPRERVDRTFDRNAPAVGEPLPDVAAYDAEGRPFRLSSLKGRPAVLVFGCLT